MGCNGSKAGGGSRTPWAPSAAALRVLNAGGSGSGSADGAAASDYAPPQTFKLVMCGDKATGKSSLVLRFTKDAFAEAVPSTIGAAFASKEVALPDGGGVVKVNVWDTAGEELYRAMTRSFFRDASAGFVVYDVTSRRTFEGVASWVRDFREQCPEALLVLVANKCDVAPEERAVSPAEGASLAQGEGLSHYHEVSAKTGAGVHEMFSAVAGALVAAARDAAGHATAYG